MRPLRPWLPALLCALTIFAMSSMPGYQLPSIPGHGADKVVHAAVYAVLAAFTTRAMAQSTRFSARAAWFLATWLATAYGASDEFHQRFVPGRSSDPADLVADGAGALLGALTYTWIAARRRRRER